MEKQSQKQMLIEAVETLKKFGENLKEIEDQDFVNDGDTVLDHCIDLMEIVKERGL